MPAWTTAAPALSKQSEALGSISANSGHFTTAPWRDAQLTAFDADALKAFGKAPLHPVQFDPKTKHPREWPLRYTLCRWTADLPKIPPGKYELRCRTLDLAGHAQPMPRPFPKSGKNQIQMVKVEVTG